MWSSLDQVAFGIGENFDVTKVDLLNLGRSGFKIDSIRNSVGWIDSSI